MEINKIYNGNCLEVMKGMENNSVDSIVTDPPYGLSFMGKKWDYEVPRVEIWKECLRVLKPGGYLLSFAGTRTQHRMAVNIEDAGFEIRDMIAWVYGSGFPKSHNIGKAIDKLQGNEREFMGINKSAVRVNSEKNHKDGQVGNFGLKGEGTGVITKGTSEWEGWGTALKPAMEPITVARKPLSEKTVAENVLKWGTGGINIDESRVELGKEKQPTGSAKRIYKQNKYTEEKIYGDNKVTSSQGRFPANFIHDGSDEVVNQFPDKTGALSPVKAGQKGFGGEIYGKYAQAGDDGATFHGDGLGSAARFFYCAKASKSERGEGNNHPTVKPIALMKYLIKLVTPEDAIILDPFCGSGTTLIAARKINRNFIGIELNKNYIEIAEKRIREELGMWK